MAAVPRVHIPLTARIAVMMAGIRLHVSKTNHIIDTSDDEQCLRRTEIHCLEPYLMSRRVELARFFKAD